MQKNLRDPRLEEFEMPEFEAVWQAINRWDIEDTPGEGYHRATGNNVVAILDALGITKNEPKL